MSTEVDSVSTTDCESAEINTTEVDNFPTANVAKSIAQKFVSSCHKEYISVIDGIIMERCKKGFTDCWFKTEFPLNSVEENLKKRGFYVSSWNGSHYHISWN